MIKDLKGYEGVYQIELMDDGSSIVRSVKRPYKNRVGVKRWNHGKDLKPYRKFCGQYDYLYVNLSIGGKVKPTVMARLIADSFIDNPNGYNNVKYIDGDRTNINISNLTWISNNERYSYGFNEDHLNYTDKTKGIKFRESNFEERYMNDEGFWRVRKVYRYSVTIYHNKKRYSLGTFSSEFDAVYVRDEFESAIKFGNKVDISQFDLSIGIIFHDDLKPFFTNVNNLPW